MFETARIPVSGLTGFLGSGKTTLLRSFLRDPAAADTAVVINEFGEIGLDHTLVEAVNGETVVMASGCVCCSIRTDLADTLMSLAGRVENGDLPPFRRLVIETTGLADPAPIVQLMLADERVSRIYGLHQLITTVDAVNGGSQLDEHLECLKQAAMADTLLVTKTDMNKSAERLEARLGRINPHARLRRAKMGDIDFDWLLDSPWYDPARRSESVRDWLGAEALDLHHQNGDHDHSHHQDVNRHDARITAFTLIIEEPVEWMTFSMWLSFVLTAHGAQLLRLKGILNVVGTDTPVAIHGVQHLLHEPVALSAWPDEDRTRKLVFIASDLQAEEIQQSWREFAGAR
jgi:G3E family GTPase